jgi:signal transduction histidine kinase/CheY-like chemotaxis protein/HPt (histidine-containing phosphotransfer) domain-containing protein
MSDPETNVSRSRYDREKRARVEAESLLENKSRELFKANAELSRYSEDLEKAVILRTEELETTLEVAQAASSARSRFIATMSHEIRTPLGGLLGMIDLLSMDEKDDAKLELLNYAKASGNALNRIVNDVLDFSKMEAGLFVFDDEAVDVRSLINSVLAMAQTNLTGQGRKIEGQINENVPKLFFGDATRTRQVISNLVSNAVRYSSHGAIIVRADASPTPKGAVVRIEVEDSGVGIEDDKIVDLFKDFSQISNPLTASAQGTGLGLAISKRIIEGCGGEIGVTSEFGKGSIFWIELPVEVMATPPKTQASVYEIDGFIQTYNVAGLRVLLAEDNPINQKLILTYLARMGAIADLAENGQIALNKFKPGKYDLILMDVAMPVMDGLAAIRIIREQWQPHDVPPVLILTAHVMDAIEKEAAAVGVDNVLCKPIPFDELRAAIGYSTREWVRQPETRSTPEPTSDKGESPTDQKPAVSSMMSGGKAEELLEFFTDEEFTDLVQKFVDDARIIVAKMAKHHASGDMSQTSTEAHSLKGSALLLGFKTISDFASEIEDNAADIEAEDVRDMVEAILAEVGEIEVRLNS